MPILVICDACGHQHRVKEEFAGRKGKCSRCGAFMLAPHPPKVEDDSFPVEADDAYGLAEAPEPTRAASRPMETEWEREPVRSSFTRVSSEVEAKRTRARRDHDDAETDLAYRILKRAPWFAIPLAIALIVVSLVVPDGVRLAGLVLSGIGGVAFSASFLVGAFAAFREDSLYGFMYVFFPIYGAYYLVTRFDDLKRWILIGVIGLGLSVLGAAMTLGE